MNVDPGISSWRVFGGERDKEPVDDVVRLCRDIDHMGGISSSLEPWNEWLSYELRGGDRLFMSESDLC